MLQRKASNFKNKLFIENVLDIRHCFPFQISLLDPKKSMNVNIFMKQFKMPNSEVVAKLREGNADLIGQEKLIGLLKILPDSTEV